jgi:FtsH-binding integral membrane protein
MNHLISAICFIVILALTLQTSSTGLIWNCDNAVASNYLYVLLAFVSIWFFITLIPENMNSSLYILAIINIFVLLFVILFIPSKYFVIKHLVWFLYLLAMAYIIKPSIQRHNIVFTVLITAGLFILLSFLGSIFGEHISLGWEKYLLMGLIGLILISVVSFFLPRNQNFIYTISYITIGLFAMFVLVDTKKILSVNCANPDYINSSMSLFLDVLNIFSAVNNVSR